MSEETKPEVEAEKGLNFDPKEVEAQLVKMAHERAEDPVETAGAAYKIYVPYYKAQRSKLTTRALRRILDFLILYPLESNKANATSELEREMMELCNTLIQAKFVMILDTYRGEAERLYNAATTPLTEEEANEVIAQLKAGGATDEDIASIHKQE